MAVMASPMAAVLIRSSLPLEASCQELLPLGGRVPLKPVNEDFQDVEDLSVCRAQEFSFLA
ncbi:hypothetical protein [Streptomyces sp. NBC_01261]|uniref:hypothetical protein n=1 Tax=unclassified Streptomyces TaxID=2593676 RepID=UPI002E31F47F|nr:hypothetical protein [Streptomyces sp. NBC_01261]